MKRFQCSPEYRQLFEKQQFGILDMVGGVASGVASGFRENNNAVEQLEHLAGAAMSLSDADAAIDRAEGLMIGEKGVDGGTWLLSPEQKRRVKIAIEKMLIRLSSRGIEIDSSYRVGSLA